MLSRVLLNVIATAINVDKAAYPYRTLGDFPFDVVKNRTTLLFRYFDDLQLWEEFPACGIQRLQFQPAGIEHLSAA